MSLRHIGTGVKLGEGTRIWHLTYIGDHTEIGNLTSVGSLTHIAHTAWSTRNPPRMNDEHLTYLSPINGSLRLLNRWVKPFNKTHR